MKLLERPAPSDVFAFPRTDEHGEPVFNVRVFVLPEKKLEACKLRARKWLVERVAKEGADVAKELDAETIGDRVSKELIAEAVHEDRLVYGSDETGKPRYHRMFRNADDVGELTGDEVGALFGAYLLTQMQFGPTDVVFSEPAAVNEWVGRLQEGSRPFVLPLLQSHQRDALLLSLTDRVSAVLRILNSPPESWQTSLESLRTSWQAGTASYSKPAAESTHTPDDDAPAREVITKEAAMEAAKALRKQSRI